MSFNWDDIEVGNHNLDHSQNFFVLRNEMSNDLNAQNGITQFNNMLANMRLDCTLEDDAVSESNKENIPTSPSIKCKLDNKKSSSHKQHSASKRILSSDGRFMISPKSLNFTGDIETNTIESGEKDIAATNVKVEICSPPPPPASPSECIEQNDDDPSRDRQLKVEEPRKLANIACMWSSQKTVVSKTVISNANGAPKETAPKFISPRAYKFMDIYKQKKEEALRKKAEEERKMRQFHSRPMPDFKKPMEKVLNKKPVHFVTAPLTPNVLKKSKEAEERRRKKLEEINAAKMEVAPIRPRAINYLKEQPFVPKKTVTEIPSCPFKLRSSQRQQERKQYDLEIQRSMEEKKKQVEVREEELKRREEEENKKYRKMATSFKARKNPFK